LRHFGECCSDLRGLLSERKPRSSQDRRNRGNACKATRAKTVRGASIASPKGPMRRMRNRSPLRQDPEARMKVRTLVSTAILICLELARDARATKEN